jgi:hypothetical protein
MRKINGDSAIGHESQGQQQQPITIVTIRISYFFFSPLRMIGFITKTKLVVGTVFI